MNRRLVSFVVVLTAGLAALAAAKSDKTELKQVKDEKYKPGQVWSYKTRPGEEASTITILRVDEAPQGKRIVHIHVDGIRLKNCTGGPEPDTVAHMPFARDFIEQSVVETCAPSRSRLSKKAIRNGDEAGMRAKPASTRLPYPRPSK